jgi:hypothetical protein
MRGKESAVSALLSVVTPVDPRHVTSCTKYWWLVAGQHNTLATQLHDIHGAKGHAPVCWRMVLS